MSRNSEKANSLLNRYHRQKNVLPVTGDARPKRVQSVKDLRVAEKFRLLCVQEISQKISRINDVSLNDYQIRDLNDELNKLTKERFAWEYHIKELGGPNYILNSNKAMSSVNVDSSGYRYFGRAKDLPDVKQMLEARKKHKTEQETQIQVAKDKKLRLHLLEESKEKLPLSYFGVVNTTVEETSHTDAQGQDEELLEYESRLTTERRRKLNVQFSGASTRSDDEVSLLHLKIPESSAIEKYIIQKKKEKLLSSL